LHAKNEEEIRRNIIMADMNGCGKCACYACFERNCSNCRDCIRGEKVTEKCLFGGDDGEPLTTNEEA
jgi:hypothetical protein